MNRFSFALLASLLILFISSCQKRSRHRSHSHTERQEQQTQVGPSQLKPESPTPETPENPKTSENPQQPENTVSVPSSLTIAFYNVENLFDPVDDPHVNDFEFTPQSELQWDSKKYQTKLQRLQEVLNALNADFIGLEEVENRRVLKDLVSLLSRSYAIIHEDSPDPRGIDVAALYDPNVWTVHEVTWLDPNPYLTSYLNRSTHYRYILEVVASPKSLPSDTFVIYVNHWPSRRNEEITRILTARFLKERLQAYLEKPHYTIVIGGDFNDEPTNASIRKTLNASTDPTNQTPLLNLAYQFSFYGTHQYRKRWYILDQIIVSRNAVERYEIKADIFHPDFLLEVNGPYAGFPWRTVAGDRYIGGYSDHLPVKVEFSLRK